MDPLGKRPQRPPQEHSLFGCRSNQVSESFPPASGTGFYVVEIREEGPGKSSTHSGRILKPIGCTQCGQGTKDALLNPNGSTKGS